MEESWPDIYKNGVISTKDTKKKKFDCNKPDACLRTSFGVLSQHHSMLGILDYMAVHE